MKNKLRTKKKKKKKKEGCEMEAGEKFFSCIDNPAIGGL